MRLDNVVNLTKETNSTLNNDTAKQAPESRTYLPLCPSRSAHLRLARGLESWRKNMAPTLRERRLLFCWPENKSTNEQPRILKQRMFQVVKKVINLQFFCLFKWTKCPAQNLSLPPHLPHANDRETRGCSETPKTKTNRLNSVTTAMSQCSVRFSETISALFICGGDGVVGLYEKLYKPWICIKRYKTSVRNLVIQKQASEIKHMKTSVWLSLQSTRCQVRKVSKNLKVRSNDMFCRKSCLRHGVTWSLEISWLIFAQSAGWESLACCTADGRGWRAMEADRRLLVIIIVGLLTSRIQARRRWRSVWKWSSWQKCDDPLACDTERHLSCNRRRGRPCSWLPRGSLVYQSRLGCGTTCSPWEDILEVACGSAGVCVCKWSLAVEL